LTAFFRDDFESVSNIEVIFAGFHKDSDSVIEEKIKANTAPRRLTVVSSDRRLRKAAAARKATAVKSEDFWEEVQKELRRGKPRKKEPQGKQEGLTEGETTVMDLFGLDEEPLSPAGDFPAERPAESCIKPVLLCATCANAGDSLLRR
jgi:hypothetical protein